MVSLSKTRPRQGNPNSGWVLARLAAALLLSTTGAGAQVPAIADDGHSAGTRFEARYQARVMGTQLKGTANLLQIDDDLWEYRFDTSSLLGKVTEVTRYRIAENGWLTPALYKYRQSALGNNKRVLLSFDWRAGRVTDTAPKKPWTLTLSPGTLDPLSMQLQLRDDVKRGKKSMQYRLPRDGRMKTYRFVVEGTETTDTVLGPLRTIRVGRDRGEGSDKFTRLWLARDWDHLIVKIRDGKIDGGEHEILLVSGSVNGIPVTPLE
jgi:hypothetical protein